MKLICSKCESEMRCCKTGVRVLDYASFGPYQLWAADEYACPDCGQKTIAGFGKSPIAEHFQSDFLTQVTNAERQGLLRKNHERVPA